MPFPCPSLKTPAIQTRYISPVFHPPASLASTAPKPLRLRLESAHSANPICLPVPVPCQISAPPTAIRPENPHLATFLPRESPSPAPFLPSTRCKRRGPSLPLPSRLPAAKGSGDLRQLQIQFPLSAI